MTVSRFRALIPRRIRRKFSKRRHKKQLKPNGWTRMDSIKVAKVDRVLCTRPASKAYGTIHLTAHHLIFCFDATDEEEKPEQEMWVPYPLISLVTRLPQTLHGFAPLAFRTRTFETFTLTFARDRDAADVFDSIRELTVITRVDQLYAFDYVPNPPFDTSDGWNIYNPREEFARMGIGSRSKAWRFTDVNKDYSFCPTYPARLVVPARISDATLTYAGKYRSKTRIPALVYLHWANYASITRSSQPMVGLTNNRSIQDEKLIEAIFQSHWAADSAFAPVVDSPSSSSRSRGPGVYGATATNLIIDARPTTNAMVMSVKGAGTENMEYYKDGKKAYLGVDNIHVMRESLSKVADALRDADQLASLHGKEAAVEGTSFLDRQALRKSGWLKHISAILDGTLIIIKNIHINSSHVLIHCSDGWDRTAQLSSLSQICLDPFYRTLRGFQILVEKDWLSFGHRFADRCGHLSSEKFFTTATGDGQAGSGNTDAAAAFLASMQNKFTPQSHIKETSPVFHQFLECVRQIQRQFPARFEYNEEFLRRLHYHLYSCQFGTFLWNNERERRTAEPGVGMPMERTRNVWDFLSSSHERPKFINPEYDPALDDRESRSPGADMGVLLFDPKDVRFWHELYGREDEEMNGRLVTSQAVGVDVIGPVDTAEGDPIVQEGVANVANIPLPPSPAPSLVPGDATKQTSLPYQPRSMSSLRAPSLTVPPSTGGSTSASPLSAAAEVPGQPPLSRSDSFRPMEASGSAFSLKAASVGQAPFSGSTAAPQPRSPTPKRTVAEGPTVTSMGVAGFRSLWGQVSSNASAALTVVQGAYEGARKDIRVPAFQLPAGFSGPPSAAGGGEMQEKLGSSSADRKWSGFEDEPSPWASSTRSVPSPLSENPWATSSAPLPSTAFSQRPLESSSSYIRQSTSENSKPLGSGSVTQSRVSDFPGLEDPLFARRPVSSSPPATDNNKRSVGPLTNDLESLTLSHSSSTITSSRISSATGPSNVAVPATPSRQSLPQNPPSEPDSGQASDPLGVGFL